MGALPQRPVRPPSTSSRIVPRPVRFVPLLLHHPCSRLLGLILLVIAALTVRLESVIFELERCQDDLLIIGHASVIRCLVRHFLDSNDLSSRCVVLTALIDLTCQLAYLVGLPPSEVPSVEIARGDLVEVVPASYGVLSRAFHFWSGPGRKDGEGMNLYENVRPSLLVQTLPEPKTLFLAFTLTLVPFCFVQVAEGTQGKGGIAQKETIFDGGSQDIEVSAEDKRRAKDDLHAHGANPDAAREFMLRAEATRGQGGFRSA